MTDDQDDLDDADPETLDTAPWREWEGPRELKPESSLRTRVIVAGLIALFWNAISWVIFVMSIRDGAWFAAAFVGLFVLVGLTIAAGFLHQFLCLFNPVVKIALESGAVPAGGEAVVAWETKGNTGRIREFIIEFTVTEKATYTRGTSTVTESNIVARIPVVRTTRQAEMAFGSLAVPIPARAVPTFDAARNKIEWAVDLRCVIPFWPDVAERFPFYVKPRGT